MKPKKSSKDSAKDSFEVVAKHLECDPDTAAFDKKLGKIAKAKTPAPTAKSKGR